MLCFLGGRVQGWWLFYLLSLLKWLPSKKPKSQNNLRSLVGLLGCHIRNYTLFTPKKRGFVEHLKIGDLDPEMAASYAGLRFWMTYAWKMRCFFRKPIQVCGLNKGNLLYHKCSFHDFIELKLPKKKNKKKRSLRKAGAFTRKKPWMFSKYPYLQIFSTKNPTWILQ